MPKLHRKQILSFLQEEEKFSREEALSILRALQKAWAYYTINPRTKKVTLEATVPVTIYRFRIYHRNTAARACFLRQGDWLILFFYDRHHRYDSCLQIFLRKF